MHGLIFVTWENYLSERFGAQLLWKYREVIGEMPANQPLASRVYDDKLLLAGVNAACRLTRVSPDILLQEYGHYYIINGLTSHRCAYLLTQVQSGRELLLTMRAAHKQMGRLPDGLTPPLFQYEVHAEHPHELVLIYNSPRQLCPLLIGAIKGAAERYGESATIFESTCMRQGDALCRLEVTFSHPGSGPALRQETPEQVAKRNAQHQFAHFIFSLLPAQGGITLAELQEHLRARRRVGEDWLRPVRLLEALQQLSHAGLVASTANQPGDDLARRRYWRASTDGT